MRIGQTLSFSPRSREYVHNTIKGAPFESVVLPRWTAELCDYCYAFVEGPRKKHVLHSIIEYILSGARMVGAPSFDLVHLVHQDMHLLQELNLDVQQGAPIRPQLLRWIGDLDAESPIVLQLVEFRERLLAVRNLDPHFGPPAICMVRWLFEGGSHVFADMELGRLMHSLLGASRRLTLFVPGASGGSARQSRWRASPHAAAAVDRRIWADTVARFWGRCTTLPTSSSARRSRQDLPHFASSAAM
jgi:hypothetical protein